MVDIQDIAVSPSVRYCSIFVLLVEDNVFPSFVTADNFSTITLIPFGITFLSLIATLIILRLSPLRMYLRQWLSLMVLIFAATPLLLLIVQNIPLAAIFTLLFLKAMYFYRCKKCKKLFALKKGRTTESHEKDSDIFLGHAVDEHGVDRLTKKRNREYYKITEYNCVYCGFKDSIEKLYDEREIISE